MPCTAGETSMVIDHNGLFRACEMRGTVGNLHDYDFDVGRVLESQVMRDEVEAIPKANRTARGSPPGPSYCASRWRGSR
jgi:hypothetical protein